MKIPDSKLVKRVILEILKSKGIVHTQEELGNLVQKELSKLDKKFHISSQRVRRLALELNGLEATVKTKKSSGKKPDRCPACDKELKSLYAKNLVGEKVVVGFKCGNCGYQGDVEAFVPMLYEFKLLKY
jgi:uncharacterized protein with PIN domain